MKKRIIFLLFLFVIALYKLVDLNLNRKETYAYVLKNKTSIYVNGASSPRGKIYDAKGRVLVDNKGIRAIFFNNEDKLSNLEKANIALELAKIINISEANLNHQQDFFMALNETDNKLTNEEIKDYKERKLTKEDIIILKRKRIDVSDKDVLWRKAAQIYYLMNKDYEYNKKEIVRDVSEEEFAKVIEANISGITGETIWERAYPYGETFKSVLGSVSKIYQENKAEYISLGYSLDDYVGSSYLEKEYENYLKGEKAIYKLESGKLKLVKPEKSGNDLYLNIDIDLQRKLESVVKEEILIAKNKPNTEYFNKIYASLGEPKTGNVKAMVGLVYQDNGEFKDITSNIVNDAFTVGSVVKGATIAVGYNNNLIIPGKYITDSCVKLYFVPQKCSFKSLGRINDITALANSSNYYQYLIAIGITGNKYFPNMKLNATKENFDTYRNTLASYGLGVKTMIDLPGEVTGMQGKTIADDLLLNEAIGQYDTYTDIQMLQYINTIAMNKRKKLNILNRVENNGEIIYKNSGEDLNDLEISNENMDRVKLGLKEVLKSGTGKGAVSLELNPAGKTGTSESFYDSDGNGTAETKTISTSLAIYYPMEEPKYSLAIIAPNISHNYGKKDYAYGITKHISSKYTDFLQYYDEQ